MTPEQERALTAGGDCFEHWHSTDRVVSHEDALSLCALEVTQSLTNGSHTISAGVDYVLADSTTGNVTLTLPPAARKLAIIVVKTSAANSVIIQAPTGTVNGAATYTLTSAYQHAKLKAIGGNYYVVG